MIAGYEQGSSCYEATVNKDAIVSLESVNNANRTFALHIPFKIDKLSPMPVSTKVEVAEPINTGNESLSLLLLGQ